MSDFVKLTRRLGTWLERNLLFAISGFLLVFIPLYPKIPLADVLPGYIVRLRLEDLLLAAAAVVYGLWVLRGKARPRGNPLFPVIAIYLLLGLISGLSAIFLTKTIPMSWLHIGKWGLHWARRGEYFFLLFLFYDSVKSKGKLTLLTVLAGLVVITATIYGFGQKYYQWPVYSTMNREFSKGWRLVLTEHARVPSTFAGHYDLAAFLVLILPLTLAMAFYGISLVKWVGRVGFISGYILLILTASRASFIAYSCSTVLFFIFLYKYRGWRFAAGRGLMVGIFSTVVFLGFGDLSGRFAQIINLSPLKNLVENRIFKMDKNKQINYLVVTDQLALVADKTDAPPIPYQDWGGSGKSGGTDSGETASESGLPPDVYQDIPLPLATKSGGVVGVLYKQRTYSDAAFAYGLSSAIRFDALWPRAIAGFKTNILLGSGYSTLTKERVEIFTEAESTDNDYLRSLGETGLLGFIFFFGGIVWGCRLLWQGQKKEKNLLKTMLLAMISGTFGLLINAIYIDVFEASKVAFTFWALMGAFLAQVSAKGGSASV